MIAGMQIAEALSKFIGKGGYDPALSDTRRLPKTMRQLIEGDFDKIDHANVLNPEYDESRSTDITAGKATRIYNAVPIQIQQLDIKRPDAPHELIEEDSRGYHPLFTAYYAWLKRKRQHKQFDIDCSLNNAKAWSLWHQFEEELHKRTGFWLGELFPQEEYEDNTGEKQIWDTAFLPIYEMEVAENDGPILEYLACAHALLTSRTDKNYKLRLPEAAFDAWDNCEEVEKASDILFQIIITRKFELLPEIWANAMKAIADYEGDIICSSRWEGGVERDVSTPDGIDRLFKEAKACNEMLEGTRPLVEGCYDESEKIWNNIISHLLKVGPIKIKKEQSKLLTEVFSEKQK